MLLLLFGIPLLSVNAEPVATTATMPAPASRRWDVRMTGGSSLGVRTALDRADGSFTRSGDACAISLTPRHRRGAEMA
jgi:hypothetical protein